MFFIQDLSTFHIFGSKINMRMELQHVLNDQLSLNKHLLLAQCLIFSDINVHDYLIQATHEGKTLAFI